MFEIRSEIPKYTIHYLKTSKRFQRLQSSDHYFFFVVESPEDLLNLQSPRIKVKHQ